MLKIVMTFLKTLIMTIALGTGVATAAPTIKHLHTVEGIKSYELSNGLEVILFPDSSKATATVNTTYLVGSRHENYGETGMAHLLEHLMFKGSKNYPDPSKEFTRRGFRMNGTTWIDRTNYFVSFTANDDNMRWALGWSADAMVNSKIAKSDLDTEMTVVRNEFEMGENRPESVMLKRMQSVLFDWHAYGRSTIGARSDIENVPIENLQAFYRRWYQPDNAVLTVSGKFDEKQVLNWIQEFFGSIPRPTRTLPKEWTQEPVSDGPRSFEIRRPGEMQLVSVGYRIPSALAMDNNACETAIDILADSPRGRLYKALVETGLASQVFGWPLSAKAPSLVMFGARVKKGEDINKVRDVLVKTIETSFAEKAATPEEVRISLTEAATDFERTLSDPEGFAVDLSDYIALGDWRLFFLDRDRTAQVTPEDVTLAAKNYFVRDNRVVGLFIPDDHPQRAPEMKTPDVASMMKDAHFKTEGEVSVSFDVSQDNINRSTVRTNINGVEVALLSKKTRGETVTVMTKFLYGNKAVAMGRSVSDLLIEAMLSRGTDKLTRKVIADKMTELKIQGDVLAFTTTRNHLAGALTLLGELTASSGYPEKEFTQYVRQMTTALEGKSDDPMTLARTAMGEHYRTYEPGDPRNPMTSKDVIEGLRKISRDEAYAWYRDVFATENGGIAIVGDFDVNAVKKELQSVLGAKKCTSEKCRYERLVAEFKPVTASRMTIDTPEKENAVILARVDFAANMNDADAPALSVANWILGSGTGLSNRLVDRLRQKEGLSYGVGSHVTLPKFGNRAVWNATAIVAPQNLARAEVCMREEIARALKDGFTETEVREAIKGILQYRAVNRAQDDYLAHSWLQFMELGFDFGFSRDYEEKLSRLTLDDVNKALRKMIDEKNITYVLAGDNSKAKKENKPFM